MSLIDAKGTKPNNHYPHWQNTYNHVEVWLCTFNIEHNHQKETLNLQIIWKHLGWNSA
jgi:pterin-4a-carbinolamine dehydratase